MAYQTVTETLLNISALTTTTTTGSNVDLAGLVNVAKRDCKLVVISSGGTYSTATQASWGFLVEECATTNGSFSTVTGDSITAVAGTPSTVATVTEYHVQPMYRYVRARASTIGTGGTSLNVAVLLQLEKRVI